MPLFKNKFKTESNRLKDWDYSGEGIYFITIVSKNREFIFGNIENNKMILNANGQIIKNELFKSIEIRDNWIFHNWVIMPNHVHLLIEIIESHPVETHPVEMHRSASQTSKNVNQQTHDVETHSSASQKSKNNNQQTHPVKMHLSASQTSKNVNQQTHDVETHLSASQTSKNNNQQIQDLETHDLETHSGASLRDNLPKKLIRKPNSISSFVAIFKSVTTKQIVNLENGDKEDALRCVSTRYVSKPCVSTTCVSTENKKGKRNEKIWQSNYHDHIVRNYNSFEMIHQYISNNPRNWNNDSINSK